MGSRGESLEGDLITQGMNGLEPLTVRPADFGRELMGSRCATLETDVTTHHGEIHEHWIGNAPKTPRPWVAPALEWRAKQIEDPVERLRFLRQNTEVPPTHFRLPSDWKRWGLRSLPLVAILTLTLIPLYTRSNVQPPVHRPAPQPQKPGTIRALPEVWSVEQNERYDLYSNGLRIENEFAVSNKTRGPFPVFRSLATGASGEDEPVERNTQPVGIVFHSTESHQAPFAPTHVGSLKRLGRNLLGYVRSQHAYHFVIDRFGRVYRVVHESDVANHAGRSVWSDSRGTYLNLNSAFLGVAFESQRDTSVELGQAQLHAARVLTEMLRSRFQIAASNCVTHAQVSVNPANMRIGYHTDWAVRFPFGQLGLPDNYAQTLPSVSVFGFDYDQAFLEAVEGRPWDGLAAADLLISERAQASGLSTASYRKRLQQRYRRIIKAHRRMNEEKDNES